MITLKTVWRLAYPMILANITVPLLGIVDTAVVGHLSAPYYLGAVAVGAMIFDFIYWGFGFLRMTTTGLIAQAHGRDDQHAIQLLLARGIFLALCFAAFLLIFQSILGALAFHFINASPIVTAYGKAYFHVRIWGAPAVMINYVLLGWFLGRENTRIPLLLVFSINATAIILDILFVFGFGWHVAGVAAATLIAQYVGLFIGLYVLYKTLAKHVITITIKKVLDWPQLKALLLLNQHIFIRTLCLMFVFAFFTSQGARFGNIVLAANAVLMNFTSLMAYALDGFANAAEILVGKAIGEQSRERLSAAIKANIFWSGVIALIFSSLYLLFGKYLIQVMTSIDNVQQAAHHYMIWVIIMPLFAVWSYLLDGIFIGATRMKEMRNSMVLSTIVIFLPVWYFTKFLGNHGLWFSFLVFLIARAASLAGIYGWQQHVHKLKWAP